MYFNDYYVLLRKLVIMVKDIPPEALKRVVKKAAGKLAEEAAKRKRITTVYLPEDQHECLIKHFGKRSVSRVVERLVEALIEELEGKD